jgi:hypothetical protein
MIGGRQMAWGSDRMNEFDVESVLGRTRMEEIRRSGAYHEAAHAVVDVVLGHTVRYVSIWTEGTDYRDNCVTAINHMEFPGVGYIPEPMGATGHAIATIAGSMADCREAGIPYPYDSWQEIVRKCEEAEEAVGDELYGPDDPFQLWGDYMDIRAYCEAAALLGKMARYDNWPDDAPPPPRIPSIGEEVFEVALREAERLVASCWWAITAVAERLIEVGYLSGEEVQEIVFGSEPSEEDRT